MVKIISVDSPRRARSSGPVRPRRPKTPILPAQKKPTWFAPHSDPLGRARLEHWDLFSRDGLWHYHRVETGARPVWHAIYLPTGQWREFSSKDTAREETYAGLSDHLARDAYQAALCTSDDDPSRAEGHRLLAIHMRVAGRTLGGEADRGCRCGGLLAVVSDSGQLAHLDACAHCYVPGRGLPQQLCDRAGQHRFCGRPQPVS